MPPTLGLFNQNPLQDIPSPLLSSQTGGQADPANTAILNVMAFLSNRAKRRATQQQTQDIFNQAQQGGVQPNVRVTPGQAPQFSFDLGAPQRAQQRARELATKAVLREDEIAPTITQGGGFLSRAPRMTIPNPAFRRQVFAIERALTGVGGRPQIVQTTERDRDPEIAAELQQAINEGEHPMDLAQLLKAHGIDPSVYRDILQL